MSSIVPFKHFNGVESYLVLDKPIYKPGSEARAHILLDNKGGDKALRVRIVDWRNNTIFDKNISVKSGDKIVEVASFGVPGERGVYKLRLYLDSTPIDEVSFIIGDVRDRRPLRLAFVWHNHQAPNYGPDGRIHSDWAFIYVYKDILKPYGYGPYHYHTVLLDKHDSYKATYNLSPSLLYQWSMALEGRAVYQDGRSIDKNGFEAKMIGETLSKYSDYLKQGRIDVLTSVYAHTILGFLTDIAGLTDIVSDEIAYGKNVSKQILGSYEPEGFWTPEMAFSMKLVKLLQDNGLEYTVLDDRNHFYYAEGEKATPYEPYIVMDPSTRSHIQVFFRDSYLSNVLSFQNNFVSEYHAWRNAFEFSYMVASKWFDKSVRLLTLALDGENWMVFSKNPPLTAYFIDKVILYLEALSDYGFISLTHLREAIEEIPARRVLYNIPTNSWLGSFRKWRGEVAEHEKYWARISEIVGLLRAYEAMIKGRDEYSNQARWALWHALDSDYWWAEFWSPKVIDAWVATASRILSERLSGVKIVDLKTPGEIPVNTECDINVEIENGLNREVSVAVVLSSWCFETTQQNLSEVSIKPRSVANVLFKAKPTKIGECPVSVILISGERIISSYTRNVYVSSRI
ncbi:glycoside hydrolase family 57 protein [Thermogladius sp. 4427co]|uniref:glycoside hydrolase family 57 protein n=1 Tax=Thermogladius sp. 4427co TaxID=3450718 RepID=UPI003F78ED48